MDPAPFDEAGRTLLEKGDWVGELEHLRSDGTTVTVEGRCSLVRDETGAPNRILSINTDVTERKKLLAQFLRARRMEAIGTLAGGIAHDLNHVLAPILLAIGLLEITSENLIIDDHYAAMSEEASPGRYVRVSVVDSGTGMPPEVLHRIFDPFFTTKEVGKGTGLGLSTVMAMIRSHGGFVNVYSEVGSGTTFRLYFPAAEVEGADVGARAGTGSTELRRRQGELIPVVDDEASVRDVTRRTLETFGYRVVSAEDAIDAVGIYGRRGDEIVQVLGNA